MKNFHYYTTLLQLFVLFYFDHSIQSMGLARLCCGSWLYPLRRHCSQPLSSFVSGVFQSKYYHTQWNVLCIQRKLKDTHIHRNTRQLEFQKDLICISSYTSNKKKFVCVCIVSLLICINPHTYIDTTA